jgi:hypothetical protein
MSRLNSSKRFRVAIATLLTLFGFVAALALYVTTGFEPERVVETGGEVTIVPESALLANRVKGSVGVSAPARAQEGDSFTVSLRVASEKLVDVLQSLQEEFPENENVLGQSNVKLTPRMAAKV